MADAPQDIASSSVYRKKNRAPERIPARAGSNDPRLEGAYAKIDRARDHIHEVYAWFDTWIDPDPWVVEREFNANGFLKRSFFRIVKKPPTSIGPVIGDAIHSLRASLDHLAAAAAVLNGRSMNGVWFPFSPTATEAEGSISDKLRKCSEPFKEFVRSIKPYQGGNDLLYSMHQLDIIDKHRKIVPVGAGTEVYISGRGLYGVIDLSKCSAPVRIPIQNGKSFIEDGDTILSAEALSGRPGLYYIQTDIATSLVFGNETPVAGQEILTTLREFYDATLGVITDAEVRFFS